MSKQDEKSSHENKKKSILLIALKKHKIGLLVVILLFSLSTTLAWFTYNRVVQIDAISTKVKAWQIDVTGDTEEEQVEKITIDLTELYPGMDAITYNSASTCNAANHCVQIQNKGEMDGIISLIFRTITLFGEEIEITEDDYVKNESGNTITYLFKEYPFSLKFTIDDKIIYKDGTDASVGPTLTRLHYDLEWNFEKTAAEMAEECGTSTDGKCASLSAYIDYYDTIDTDLGERSYQYHSTNPEDDDLIITLTLYISEYIAP